MIGPVQAARIARSSTFCVCPTGDSKGFTARFYYALLHGCIPVRLDAYPRRNLTLERVALPFPSQLNWSKLMVNVRNAESILRDTPGFLRQLRDMPKEEVQARQLLRLEQCIGEGYAKSTSVELEFLIEVSRATGVVLDPVYSGKAALGMVADLKARPVAKACFIHTGGLLGLFAQEEMLAQLVGAWQ